MRPASRWTAPDDIAASVGQLWESGALLRARCEGVPIFPFELRFRQPGAIEMGQQFEAVRDWIAALTRMSRDARGHGYELVWREINHRQLGRNRIPVAALIPSEADALRIIGRANEARRFDQLADMTLDAFPGLRSWVARQPLKLIQHDEQWERVLAVLRWFMAHPQPRIYLRQLDIAGVDTKFIESYKALFLELLNEIMPAETILATAYGVRQFEERFGLLTKPALIRFRMLDPDYYIAGLSDLTVPVSQFAKFECQVQRIFVTENEINALAFPAIPGGMVVFGGGYGIERLAQVKWLEDKEVLYWGDIDTHGFVILDRLRSHVPHTRSLLMDARTLQAHRTLWGKEEAAARYTGELNRLSEDEYRLFVELRDNIHGPNLRMEQERIPYTWAVEAIRNVLAPLAEREATASEAGPSPY
ncbi:MAG: Wadjet anti-phage system protein JetD domain-containing protein [Pseudomonadota bacterium]